MSLPAASEEEPLDPARDRKPSRSDELPGQVPDAPSYIVLDRDRDLAGRGHEVWVRRALLLLVLAVPVAALFNVFGQHPSTSEAASSAASLELYAPTRLRGGLLYQARIHITAHREIKRAIVLLDPGWAESMTINTVEPSPSQESSDNGRLAFDLGDIPAGQSSLFFLQFQVNPTNVGHRSADVSLRDGSVPLASIHRSLTIFP